MDIVLLQVGTPAGTSSRGAADFRAPSPSTATNLGTAFANIARARADHPAVATKDGVFSYDWVLRAADCVREYLHGRPGYAAGARIALQLSNSPEYLAAYYGALLADCVVVPLPVSLEAMRRQKVIELCQPDVLISRPEDFGSQVSNSAIVTLRLPDDGAGEISFSPARRQNDDLAMLLFTSGSMGMPKGVMLSHRNLLANAEIDFA